MNDIQYIKVLNDTIKLEKFTSLDMTFQSSIDKYYNTWHSVYDFEIYNITCVITISCCSGEVKIIRIKLKHVLKELNIESKYPVSQYKEYYIDIIENKFKPYCTLLFKRLTEEMKSFKVEIKEIVVSQEDIDMFVKSSDSSQ